MAATFYGNFLAAILDFRGHQVQSDLMETKAGGFVSDA